MCKPKPTDLWGDVGVSECMHVYKHGYGWRLVDVLEANAQTTKRPNDQTTNDFFCSKTSTKCGRPTGSGVIVAVVRSVLGLAQGMCLLFVIN